ncbi:MAG: rRNA maturation RNase YbeY [Holosporales bacterium]|jgi:probable rRNA maturation factor|nr:rRNA maturation RNase YbeY [Holosporales bacterium]
MSKNRLNIEIKSCEEWEKTPGFTEWERLLSSVLDCSISKKYGNDITAVTVDLHLINNLKMQELNLKFMQKNATTNVLSFPQFEATEIDFFLHSGWDHAIGDVFLSYNKIMQESQEFEIPFFNRCTHLFVHGVLHLIGMNHAITDAEKEMEDTEICILEVFGIKNPYILGDQKIHEN